MRQNRERYSRKKEQHKPKHDVLKTPGLRGTEVQRMSRSASTQYREHGRVIEKEMGRLVRTTFF